MAKTVITRGNTVYFSFTFYDENDDEALVDSATLTLTYPGRDHVVTETVNLVDGPGETWTYAWDCTKSRTGWVEYHAHALDQSYQLAEDGRFRLRANRANYDHDELPERTTSTDYSDEP